MTQHDDPQDARSKTPCPTCGTLVASDVETYPFCCKRCRMIDLGKWLKGDYVISRPIEQSDMEEE